MDLERLVDGFQSKDWLIGIHSVLPQSHALLTPSEVVKITREIKVALDRSQHSRALKWISLGLYLDQQSILKDSRRRGLFRASKYGYRSSNLAKLIREVIRNKGLLHLTDDSTQYFEDVATLLLVCPSLLRAHGKIVDVLRRKQKTVLKTVIALVDILFMQPHRADRTASADKAEFYSREDYAEALSFLIFTFNRLIGISDRHLNWIDWDGVSKGIYDGLLIAACKIRAFHEAEVLLDVFSYRATKTGPNSVVVWGDPSLEKAIRLGYIQTDLQQTAAAWRNFDPGGDQAASFHDLTTGVYEKFGTQLVRRVEEPLPRYIMVLPGAPEFFSLFRGEGLFREEVVYLRDVSKSQYSTLEQLLTFKVKGPLTLFDIVRVQRLVAFTSGIVGRYFEPLLDVQGELVLTSILPVCKKEQLHDVLSHLVDKTCIESLEEMVVYQGDEEGMFDIQYRPIIATEHYYMIPTNIFAMSNLVRSALYSQGKKVQTSLGDDPVQAILAKALRHRSENVAQGVKRKFAQGEVEVDVLAKLDDVLLVIECKNSFHPCGIHELRTSYDHLARAAEQLARSKAYFQDIDRQTNVFRELHWDDNPAKEVITCIVTGNRMFNGYTISGHPVRQVYELVNLILDGHIIVADEDFKLWKGDTFATQDLLDYINGRSIHDDLFDSMEKADFVYPLDRWSLTMSHFALDPHKFLERVRKRFSDQLH